MPKFIKDSKVSSLTRQRISEKIKSNFEFALNVLLLELSEEISKQLIRKNMTKAQLAQMLGTSRAYVTQLLTGKPNLTLFTLFKICKTVGLNPVMRFETESLEASALTKAVVGTKEIPASASFTIEQMPEYEEAH